MNQDVVCVMIFFFKMYKNIYETHVGLSDE